MEKHLSKPEDKQMGEETAAKLQELFGNKDEQEVQQAPKVWREEELLKVLAECSYWIEKNTPKDKDSDGEFYMERLADTSAEIQRYMRREKLLRELLKKKGRMLTADIYESVELLLADFHRLCCETKKEAP